MLQIQRKNPLKVKIKCSVKECGSTSADTTLCFHTFPAPNGRFVVTNNYFGNKQKVDLLTAWKKALDVKIISKNFRVCSKHFKKDDYYLPDISCTLHKLRGTAVPSCNLPTSNKKKEKIRLERSARILGREQKKLDLQCKKEAEKLKLSSNTQQKSFECEETENVTEENPKIQDNIECVVTENVSENYPEEQNDDCICNIVEENRLPLKKLVTDGQLSDSISEDLAPVDNLVCMDNQSLVKKNEYDVTKIKLASKDFGVQIDTKYTFFQLISNKNKLSTATGIESFELLDTIVKSVRLITKDKYEHEMYKMKTIDRILMTYVKLKQNLSYNFLALIFDSISASHCRTIFLEMIRILSQCLIIAIPWPSKEELSKNVPQCFKDFEDTRVVVDCTEIFIQRPKKLCCQIITYSHYKGSQTAKIMTGVTPGGNISFISKPYGGRASDSVIFEQSNLVNLLEPKDGVMVDKGFLIAELCKKKQFKFIQPPFLKAKKQFSREESMQSAKIAKARVHVERSNQRIKVFKILGSVMPVSLVPYLQDIFTVICGTVNLSAPIIGTDKFMEEEMEL